MKTRTFFFICLGIAASTAAYANMGTGLMIVSSFHLFVGNAIIGLLEGLALAFAFHLSRWKTVALMMAGNYFSAWIGVAALPWLELEDRINLGNVITFLWVMTGLTFAASYLLEFPFAALAFRKQKRGLAKAAGGFLVVQTASSLLLFWVFSSSSFTSLMTDARWVEAGTMDLPANVSVYYISAEDGDAYKMSLADRKPVKVFDLNSQSFDDILALKPASSADDDRQLTAYLSRGNPDERVEAAGTVVLPATVSADAAPVINNPYWDEAAFTLWHLSYRPQKLGSASDSDYDFYTDTWRGTGLRVRKEHELVKILALETPFAVWNVHSVVQLPAEKALFTLEKDRLCIYDLKSNRIALLASGYGCTAALEPVP